MKKILVTGGAGYIGSHAVLELLLNGYEVVVYDNFSNSSPEALDRVSAIAQQVTNDQPILRVIEGDIRNGSDLVRLFDKHSIDAVLHFAGLKAVGESTQAPLLYYDNNVTGTVVLLQAMQKAGVRRFIFSSSATVYGQSTKMPLDEESPVGDVSNPYGRSKLIIEEMLRDLVASGPQWSVAILRYFNPVGAHQSGLIGEDPLGVPNNLVPFLSQVAIGKRPSLSVYGGDYPTPDGTGVRDYIHVVDLARGHLAALDWAGENSGLDVWNLGTGNGYSVLEVIAAYEKVSGKRIPYEIVSRRPGDVAESWAKTSRAKNVLGWEAEKGLEVMMEDTWRWQQKNPNGYNNA